LLEIEKDIGNESRVFHSKFQMGLKIQNTKCTIWFEFNGEKGHCQIFEINFLDNKATRENLFSDIPHFFQSDLQNYFQSMESTQLLYITFNSLYLKCILNHSQSDVQSFFQ